MRFLHGEPTFDLTYSDVFMVPSRSAVPSRMTVDLTTPDGVGTHVPIVVSNMTAIAGRRMAETIARRGGLVVLPQDIPTDVIERVVDFVKSRDLVADTPITLEEHETVGEALSLIHKRSHAAVLVLDAAGRPSGVFTEHDAAGVDRFAQLHTVMSREIFALPHGLEASQMFERLNEARLQYAPVIDGEGRLRGCITRKGALRSTIYRPATDARGRLMIAAAVRCRPRRGRHGARAPGPHARRVDGGAPRGVVGAAGGGQRRDGGGHARPDRRGRGRGEGRGGPRRHVHDAHDDRGRAPAGRLYKESFGMASNRAVKQRTRGDIALERARKELFEEGISTSRMYLDPARPGVEDVCDQIVAGVRSACTYAGAASIAELHERAVIGVQSSSGYDEGLPRDTSW